MIPDSDTIVGLILAGGASRRMGEKDKAFALLEGQSLFRHVSDRLALQVGGAIYVSSNSPKACFAAFPMPYEIVADVRPGRQGPLSGLEATFTTTGAQWIVSVPVDVPFFPENLVSQFLLAVAQSEEVGPVIAKSGGQRHPVVGLWPRGVLPEITAALDRQDRGVHYFLRHMFHTQVDFPMTPEGLDPFFNINTPEDLELAHVLIKKPIG